jgi:hypothetical protein
MCVTGVRVPTVTCETPCSYCVKVSQRHARGDLAFGSRAVLLFFVLLLNGCGSSGDSNSDQSSPAASPAGADKLTHSPGPVSVPADSENFNAFDEPVLPALAAQETQPNGPSAPNETTPETPSLVPDNPTTDTPTAPAVVDSSSNTKPNAASLPPRLPIPHEAARQAALKAVLATFDADFKATQASKTFDPKKALVGTLRSAA